MPDVVPVATMPWFSSEHGWMVGALPVLWWGSLLDEPARLPERWSHGGDGRGSCEQSDFEFECFVHLAEHEHHRLAGTELLFLANCTDDMADDQVISEAAQTAAAAGETLVGWCPGVTWFWPSEQRGKPFRS